MDEELEDEFDDDELELDDELEELDELDEFDELEEVDELEELDELLEELEDEPVCWSPPQATSPILNRMTSQPLFIICLITVVVPLGAFCFRGILPCCGLVVCDWHPSNDAERRPAWKRGDERT